MRRMLLVLTILLTPVFPVPIVAAAEIAWHDGTVQSAFDRAAREEKPLFLYWGAVWCPPCAQIKKTIFTQREFIEKSKLFIPVYLDGDTESAQIWGERLQISGYPTMLVMSPAGHEVLRMPTGLQLEEFNRVLDEALSQLKPIGDVLDAALAADDPADVTQDSYRLLAYHSWDQEKRLDLDTKQKEAKFRLLAERVPEAYEAERSRLFTLWIQYAASLAGAEPEKGKKPFRLSKAERKEVGARLWEILDSPELTLVNLQFLTYYSDGVVPLVHPKPGKGRKALVAEWLETMGWVEQNDSLSVRERMSALYPLLDLHELDAPDDTEWDPEILARVRKRAQWTEGAAGDGHTRQSSLSTAGYLLRRVGLPEEAKSLYLNAIETSDAPYYFMSSLATLAHKDGDTAEAVGWLRKAYETTEGRATRFQWGTNYLTGLMDWTPDDAAKIRDESLRVFEVLLKFDDAFAGRNNARVNRLATKYADWNADQAHADEIAALRIALLPLCDELGHELENDSLQDRCRKFFNGLGG